MNIILFAMQLFFFETVFFNDKNRCVYRTGHSSFFSTLSHFYFLKSEIHVAISSYFFPYFLKRRSSYHHSLSSKQQTSTFELLLFAVQTDTGVAGVGGAPYRSLPVPAIPTVGARSFRRSEEAAPVPTGTHGNRGQST